MLWLPDVNDRRDCLADECRRLADLTPDEEATAAGFADLTTRTEEWR
jgi:hypothetical protein